MSKYMTRVLVPDVPKLHDIHRYLEAIDDTRIYSNFGPLNQELINRVSNFFDVDKNLIQTACNATLALQGAIETSEEENNLWQLPAWTFIATPLSVHHAKKEFEFVDVSLGSWRAEFSKNNSNFVDVLPFGDSIDYGRYVNKKQGSVVIDAAASFESIDVDFNFLNCNVAIVISLHATKLLPAGEGAIFLTNSEEWSQRFRSWTNFGFSSSRNSQRFGTNAKMSEYAAAIALASLDNRELVVDNLSSVQKSIKRISNKFGLLNHPALEKGLLNPYWVVFLESSYRKRNLQSLCDTFLIETREWWGQGCHKSDIFIDYSLDLPNTDLLGTCTLGLPMHSSLKESDFQKIEMVFENLDRL